MNNEADRSADRAEIDEDQRGGGRVEPRDTDKVGASVTQGAPPPNAAADVDPDAPGLSALGEQAGAPVEPNEPA